MASSAKQPQVLQTPFSQLPIPDQQTLDKLRDIERSKELDLVRVMRVKQLLELLPCGLVLTYLEEEPRVMLQDLLKTLQSMVVLLP